MHSKTPNLILNKQGSDGVEKVRSEEDLACDRVMSRGNYDDNFEDSNPLKIEFS